MGIKQILCALRGHGGVTFKQRVLDNPMKRVVIDWTCKRCGREWSGRR